MSVRRFISLVLVGAALAGVCSCSANTSSKPQNKESLKTETYAGGAKSLEESVEAIPTETAATKASLQTEVKTAEDSKDGKLVVYSYNDEFKNLVDKYSSVKDIEYVKVDLTDSQYIEKLDSALAGDNAPDIFVCDADNAKKYIDSGVALPLNEIGIDSSSYKEMYSYTVDLATDNEGLVRGIAWKAEPCCIFYNRSLAEQYLGAKTEEQAAACFRTWEAFINSATTVTQNSEGRVKLVAGLGDIAPCYLSPDKSSWIKDGKLAGVTDMNAFFEYAKKIKDNDLTFNLVRWSNEWKESATDKSVVAFYGPMWLARDYMALDPSAGIKANPTAGDWGVVPAPENYYWGGSWVMVSSKCDMKKSCADIIRAVCLDESNLREMSGNKVFVNNKKIMGEMATGEDNGLEWLGGQNPYKILTDAAEHIDSSSQGKDDAEIQSVFIAVVDSFLEGRFKSKDDAMKTFSQILVEEGIIKG